MGEAHAYVDWWKTVSAEMENWTALADKLKAIGAPPIALSTNERRNQRVCITGGFAWIETTFDDGRWQTEGPYPIRRRWWSLLDFLAF